jgi:hypothetical protein
LAPFIAQAEMLEQLWERLRGLAEPGPGPSFLAELMGDNQVATQLNENVVAVGLEILQFMENVYLDLRLDDFWEHPDNRGWALLFLSWARSPRLRAIWAAHRSTFGIRFEYFCHRRIGFAAQYPVARVSPIPA